MAMRWLHFRVNEQLYARAQRAAEADRRSLSNWVALTIERATEAMPDHPDPHNPTEPQARDRKTADAG
jgi:hypothetical protein